jgi:hypothetical protein
MNDAFSIGLLTLIGAFAAAVLGIMIFAGMKLAGGSTYTSKSTLASWTDIFVGSLRGDSLYDKDKHQISNPYFAIYIAGAIFGLVGGGVANNAATPLNTYDEMTFS